MCHNVKILGEPMNAVAKDVRVSEHPVDPQFPGRWSPRSFTDEAVSEAEVLTLLEAARWAPSASNNQPWRFVWALRGEAGFDAILAGLVPFNQSWADKAAALIVVASKSVVTKDGADAPNGFHAFDSGAAWGYLALQAHLNGLVAHAMGGFDHAKTAEAIGLPESHVMHAVVAVGHQGDAASLPEGLRPREVPSPRLSLAEVAKRGKFGA